MRKRYKFLGLKNGKIKSKNGNCYWDIGKWKKLDEELLLCKQGFHCSKKPVDAFYWVAGEVLAIVEVNGKSIIDADKECYEEMRIARAYRWTKKDNVALAIYSAELVLENYEKIYPNDNRPRKAIEAAKKVLKIDNVKNRAAAEAAAWAAWSAAEAVAWATRAAWTAEATRAARAAEAAAINKINKWIINHIKKLEEIK